MAREATAAALPVIAGEDSNYGELVRDHAIGVFTRLDAEDLARAMKLFIDHPEFVLTMGQAAVDFARTWSWQKVAQELLEMYQKILHISARPTIPTVAI
jgi:glycosyltransferase involved in cell wall biosynthesis